MTSRKERDAEMSSKDAEAMVEIGLSNFNRREAEDVSSESLRVRCVYDCDCTVVGGTDPIPPAGTATGVVAYGVGSL